MFRLWANVPYIPSHGLFPLPLPVYLDPRISSKHLTGSPAQCKQFGNSHLSSLYTKKYFCYKLCLTKYTNRLKVLIKREVDVKILGRGHVKAKQEKEKKNRKGVVGEEGI